MTATTRNIEGQNEASILREILSALHGLMFGSVAITVHNDLFKPDAVPSIGSTLACAYVEASRSAQTRKYIAQTLADALNVGSIQPAEPHAPIG